MEKQGASHKITSKKPAGEEPAAREYGPFPKDRPADYRGSNSAPWGKPVAGGIYGQPYVPPKHDRPEDYV